MGFKCFVKEHARKGMMVQTFKEGILKLNHLLPDELFKWKKTRTSLVTHPQTLRYTQL